MHKLRLVLLFIASFMSSAAFAAADRQSFGGAGLGLRVLAQNGSGTGVYLQLHGGYAFTPIYALGLHGGYSNVGTVRIRTFDFGAFGQMLEPDSGLYLRLYLDGVNASVNDGGSRHGVQGNQTGFAPGLGVGMLIPTAGDFHLVPEVTYHAAFLDSAVNLIDATFNLMWDF
ncbi:MAG: hypothetical protein AB1540_05820 [Bdellovibrionota bacterium]